jgi:hypothetical protein
MPTHWYIATLYIGKCPVKVYSNHSRSFVPFTGSGESHEDAIEDMNIDAETFNYWCHLAEKNQCSLRIVVKDAFKYEKILYKPAEDSK